MGGDFVNVFVGICVDDISNKNLTHAMCVNRGLSISYIEGAIHEKRGRGHRYR